MKKINKVAGIMWLVFIVSSCMNTINNTSDIKDSQKSKVIVNDTISTSKTSPVLNGHEIIGEWLKESIKQQVVIDKLGLPEKKNEGEYWGAIGTYIQNWEYSSLGINLEMESESQGGDKIVRSITIVEPCKFTTSQGIGIGSITKIVKEKYLKQIDASNSDANTIVVGSIYGGTIFTLKDGAVSKIFIGAAAE